MKIAIGSDHGGVELKTELVLFVQGLGHEIIDVGTDSKDSCDYPLFGIKVGESVRDEVADYGILVCTSGVGITIAANKVKGIRAAQCYNDTLAKLARQHNNANVVGIGAAFVDVDMAKKIVETFLSTEFEGGRHQRRVNLITEYEKTE